jgi:hypothetical protein
MSRTALNWAKSLVSILTLLGLLVGCSSLKLNPYNLTTKVIPLPFNIPISYDDFTYDAHLKRVIIPAGESGQVALIDPTTLQYQLLSGFSKQEDPANPIMGTSAVAVAGEYLYGLDQETVSIIIIDLNTGNVVGTTPVQSPPDYIRYISATNELWVTEKDLEQIEVFSISADTPPVVQSTGEISSPNGPEALVIDDTRGLAFTNRSKQSLTDVIQVQTHAVIAHWGNGCSSAKGMAVDTLQGYLFVVCGEGKLVIMDINNDGYQISSFTYGGKLDFVAYNPQLHHVYLPSSVSGIVAIFQLQTLLSTPQPTLTNPPHTTPTIIPSATPGATPTPDFKTSLALLGTADTAVKAKCVTVDEFNNIWVCNPNNGQVFMIHDTFPDNGEIP